ncbi:MAG: hypothetical protein FJW40_02055 [Acidobacteria bacterium]|nr:hypothetical protein [Acidobacteriota bacterium]
MIPLQRWTGIALLIYLLLHIRTIHTLSEGPQAFDRALAVFRHPLFKLGEVALLATVIAHAANGLTLTLFDLGYGHRARRRIRMVAAVAGGALFLAGGVPLFLGGVMGR